MLYFLEENMQIIQVTNNSEKQKITRHILEQLSDWFEISEAREKYIKNSVNKTFFCAYDNDKPVGFLYLTETGKDTVELHVMGVLSNYQRKGVGSKLFEFAKQAAAKQGYSFIQVKTVQMGKYKEYDKTNMFYLSLGFKELEVFPTLWDEFNPCQIYVLSLI